MSTDPFDDDPHNLESLLEGQGSDTSSLRIRRLANLLAAATAPAHPHELRGEHDALAAFRAAREHRVQPVDQASRWARMRRSLVAKIAAAVVAIAAMGTTAVAMATGSVPHVLVRTPPSISSEASAAGSPPPGGEGRNGVPFSPAIAAPGTSASPTPTNLATPPGSPRVPSRSPSPTGGSPSLTGLCGAYLAISPPQRRQALEDPRFAPLVASAGGREKVGAYCKRIEVPSPRPTRSPHSSASPLPEVSSSPAPQGSMLEEKL